MAIGDRTLLVSKAGLENAKSIVTAYKVGDAQAMTPEIWSAKKIVDSTLHPGKGIVVYIICALIILTSNGYREACTITIPNVVLRDFEPSRYCRHAHAWIRCMCLRAC